MENSIKKILLFIVVITVIVGTWLLLSPKKMNIVPERNPQKNQIPNTQGDKVIAVSGLTTSSVDTSNKALDNDLAAIDNQLAGLVSDLVAVNNGVLQLGASQANTLDNVSISTIISTADEEINQKTSNLSALIDRIDLMQKLSDTRKASLAASLQGEIDELAALKAEIDLNTNKIDAISDYNTITRSYVKYNMLLSQATIIAAAERVLVINISINTVNAKISARTSNFSGGNFIALNSILSILQTDLASADSLARSSVTSVLGINTELIGDKTSVEKLKGAADNLNTANNKLIDARKNIGTLANYAKGF